MIYLLIVVLVLYVVAWLLYRQKGNSPDESLGSTILSALVACVAGALSLAYLVLAVWHHQFL